MPYARTRRVQRVHLPQPLVARLGATPVVIVDISVLGARLEHNTPISTGSQTRLTFVWEDEEITADCRIVRSRVERFSVGADGVTVYNAGIEFSEIPDEIKRKLKAMIARFITRALEEQKLNARGVMPEHPAGHMPIFRRGGQLSANAKDLKEAVGASVLPVARMQRESGFICYHLENRTWKKKKTQDPGQPPEGFTISALEDPEQAEMLCSAYANADANGRKLIQLFAQLSIVEGDGATLSYRFQP